MKTQLENIYKNATADIEKSTSIADIEEIRNKYLSRKGEFNEIKKGLKDLSDEDKAVAAENKKAMAEDAEKFKSEHADRVNAITEYGAENVNSEELISATRTVTRSQA